MDWKIRTYGVGPFKLFSDEPYIFNARKIIVSQDSDSFTFQTKIDYTSDALFAIKGLIEIYRDDTRWFVGRLVKTPRDGKPESEQIGYEISGPWYFLENCVYQQLWKSFDITGVQVVYAQSHLLLNVTQTGAIMSQKAQLNAALDWCIAANTAEFGFPLFQYVNNIPDFNVPIDEVRDATCEEVVRRMLRLVPDAVTWFDYATTPPTLYIDRRSKPLTAVVKDCSSSDCSGNSILARSDLQVPAVVLKFERTTEVNGAVSNLLDLRVYPDDGLVEAATAGLTVGSVPWINAIRAVVNAQPYIDKVTAAEKLSSAMVATVSLRGTVITTTQSFLSTQTITPTVKDWWITKYPWLKDASDFTVIDGSVTNSGTLNLPREIIDGAATDWMNITVEPVTITAKVSYFLTDKFGTKTADIQFDTLTTQVNSTNGITKLYSTGSATLADEVPEDLAKVIYDSCSVLHFDGLIEFHQDEVDGSVSVGNILNLSGGRAEWATMNALVQQVTEDIDSGITSVTVGPAKHLGPDDLIEWLRFNRGRFVYTPLASRTGGIAPTSTILGKNTSKTNATNAGGNEVAFQILGAIGDQTLTGDDRPVGPILKLSGNSVAAPTARIQIGEPAIITGDVTVKQLDVNHADIATGKVIKVRTMSNGSQVVCSQDFSGGTGGLAVWQ